MIFSYLQNMQSHPSWVCGLKLALGAVSIFQDASHPSWVCGLKLMYGTNTIEHKTVTPFVGVWIETRLSTTTL